MLPYLLFVNPRVWSCILYKYITIKKYNFQSNDCRFTSVMLNQWMKFFHVSTHHLSTTFNYHTIRVSTSIKMSSILWEISPRIPHDTSISFEWDIVKCLRYIRGSHTDTTLSRRQQKGSPSQEKPELHNLKLKVRNFLEATTKRRSPCRGGYETHEPRDISFKVLDFGDSLTMMANKGKNANSLREIQASKLRHIFQHKVCKLMMVLHYMHLHWLVFT